MAKCLLNLIAFLFLSCLCLNAATPTKATTRIIRTKNGSSRIDRAFLISYFRSHYGISAASLLSEDSLEFLVRQYLKILELPAAERHDKIVFSPKLFSGFEQLSKNQLNKLKLFFIKEIIIPITESANSHCPG
jgi:hypothetical protein